MTKKTNNPSNQKPDRAKKKNPLCNKKTNCKKRDFDGPPWAEAYQHCFSFTYKPVTEAFINAFFEDLFKYITSDEEIYQVEKFYLSKGISVSTYHGWVHKWPLAKKVNELCMNICGQRRELGALKNELNPKFVSSALYAYLPQYREAEEWRSSLREKENDRIAQAFRIVEMPTFESSPLVPEKDEHRDKDKA